MGLFNDLGKKFEQLKREAEASADEAATHGCRDCKTALYTDYDECPECGSDRIAKLSRD
jgi:rRNA maturation endonuclease Nob1